MSAELLDGGTDVLHRGADHHPARGDERDAVHVRSTTAWCAETGDPPAPPSSSATTARRSGRRSRCTTWPPGRRRTRRSPAALRRRRRAGTVVDLLEAGAPPAEVDAASLAGVAATGSGRISTGTATPSTTSTFANAVPADDPAPLLETLRFYLRGEGSDPYERQRRSAAAPRAGDRARAGPAGPAATQGVHAAGCVGRRRWRRCAKTRSPMSDWPGRSCVECSASSVVGWSSRVSSTERTTCSGCIAAEIEAFAPSAHAVPRPRRRRRASARRSGAGSGASRRRSGCRKAAGWTRVSTA